MKLKDAIARIEELEKRVRDLEARPIFIPQPYPVPAQPFTPIWQQPVIGTPAPAIPMAQPSWIICHQGNTAVL